MQCSLAWSYALIRMMSSHQVILAIHALWHRIKAVHDYVAVKDAENFPLMPSLALLRLISFVAFGVVLAATFTVSFNHNSSVASALAVCALVSFADVRAWCDVMWCDVMRCDVMRIFSTNVLLSHAVCSSSLFSLYLYIWSCRFVVKKYPLCWWTKIKSSNQIMFMKASLVDTYTIPRTTFCFITWKGLQFWMLDV